MAEGITGRQQTENTKAIAGLGKIMERVEKVIAHSPWSGEKKGLTFRWQEVAGETENPLRAEQVEILTAGVPLAATPQGGSTTLGIAGNAIVQGSAIKALADADVFTKGADAAINIVTPLVTSGFGEEAGTLTSSVFKGIGTGVTLGAAVGAGNPVVVLVGGIIGAGVGFFTGLVKNFESKSDAFKDYYKSQYETVTLNQSEALQRGITLAGGEDEEYTSVVRQKETLEAARERYLGEGYVAERTPGLEEQNEWLEGDGGPGMKDAYAMIGRFQAAQENNKEALEREALNAVMSGGELEQYQENGVASAAGERLLELRVQYEALVKSNDVNAGAQMGALLAEAQVIANNEYNASAGAQEMLDANLSLIANIRENSQLKDEYFLAGHTMGQEFSKGLSATIRGGATSIASNYTLSGGIPGTAYDSNFGYYSTSQGGAAYYGYGDLSSGGYPTPHAWGLNRVPYDNFPALLHQGERVLTAREARAQDGSGGVAPIQIDVHDNSFSGTMEQQAEQIMRIVAPKLLAARAVQAPK